MFSFQNVVEINVPKKELFDFITHMDNFPKWNYAVKRISRVDQGEKYRLFRDAPGPLSNEEITIREIIDSKKFVLDINGGLFPYTIVYSVSEQGKSKSRLINEVYINPVGVNKIFFSLFKKNIKNAVYQNLNVLKGMLENENDPMLSKL